MSGLNEIIEWVQSEIILDTTQSVNEQYADISREFEKDNRLPLDDILLDDKAKFLEFLESRKGIQPEPEAEEDLSELESRVNDIERGIDEVSKRIGKTGESILTRVVNFFKGLFR